MLAYSQWKIQVEEGGYCVEYLWVIGMGRMVGV